MPGLSRPETQVIINRRAGAPQRGAAAGIELSALFAAHGVAAEFTVVSSTRAARAAATAASRRGVRMIVAVGGDGTVAAVAAALVGKPVVLGIVPRGTMNNLAYSLGIPTDPEGAVALIASGAVCAIDVGTIRSDADPRERYFLETAGVGITALAAPFGEAVNRGRWHRALGWLREIVRAHGTRMQVELDQGTPLFAETHLVTASNAPLVGPRAVVAPGAVLDDGLLDIALFPGMTKLALAGYFAAAVLGRQFPPPLIGRHRARHVVVHPARPRPATADLRLFPAAERWEIGILPRSLRVIAGSGPGLCRRAPDEKEAVPQ
ncbi:MAG: diacylglycerol kinase family protein [Chloroflexota bacterium]|nr:hypothetical protein [Dehalococcoidia bacterium]MDW8253727.1 diacylglycerol kinase family protein [Chloroflexota bacterium]